jgi:predicted nucleic acid-binding protein
MTEVFADTFYWLALWNRRDAYHDSVARTDHTGPLVTTDAVRLEVMDAFSARRFRPAAVHFWEMTTTDHSVVVVELSIDLLARAADLFRQRLDKDWSLTDCLSFVVMADRGIRTALTADHHFEQAGFEIAFKPPA